MASIENCNFTQINWLPSKMMLQMCYVRLWHAGKIASKDQECGKESMHYSLRPLKRWNRVAVIRFSLVFHLKLSVIFFVSCEEHTASFPNKQHNFLVNTALVRGFHKCYLFYELKLIKKSDLYIFSSPFHLPLSFFCYRLLFCYD